jgi:hypothetical protein
MTAVAGLSIGVMALAAADAELAFAPTKAYSLK